MVEKQLFVEFYFSSYGQNYREEKRINSKKNVSFPKNTFAFRFFEREVTVRNGEESYSEAKNISEVRFCGEVYTVEEIKRFYPQKNSLVKKCEAKRCQKVVKVKEMFFPFNDKDIN